MDGIANVARQQQSQVTPQEVQTKVAEQSHMVQKSTESNIHKNTQEINNNNNDTKINSQKKVEELVKNLNNAVQPLNPDIKFGVDQNDIFYVAAIDAKTHKIIRRFPAEQAQELLPKMQ